MLYEEIRNLFRGYGHEPLFVEGSDPHQMHMKMADAVDVALAFNFQSIELAPTDATRLVPGTFVGVVAEPAAPVPRALLVLVYYAGFEGGGEGRIPWDLTPRSTMTRATIAHVAADAHSRTLTLRYAGREEDVRLGDDVPVVAMLGGGHTRLRPGEHVFVTATRQRDGALTAGRIYYGSEGYVPPL